MDVFPSTTVVNDSTATTDARLLTKWGPERVELGVQSNVPEIVDSKPTSGRMRRAGLKFMRPGVVDSQMEDESSAASVYRVANTIPSGT